MPLFRKPKGWARPDILEPTPQAAYSHGYRDGWLEAQRQMREFISQEDMT